MANEPTVQNLDQTPAQTPEQKPKTSAAHKTLTVIGIILCVILIPMLIANIALIVKSYTGDENTPPSLFNVTPMIVLTDSMSPVINGGDLIFATKVDPTTIKEGDIISFFDPASKTGALLTHRVEEVGVSEKGTLYFRTKGDFNNTEDKQPVKAEDVIGVYAFRIPYLGSVAMFMQTTVGLIVCVVVPLLALIAYDVIRRKKYEKSKKQDTDALLKELEELRAAQAAAPAPVAENAPAEETPVAEETPAE